MKFFSQHSQSVLVVPPGHLGDMTVHLGVDKDDVGDGEVQ